MRSRRLQGRPLGPEDLQWLHDLHQDPDVMRFLGGVRTQDETAAWLDRNVRHWDEHGFGQWVLSVDGQPVGRGGLRWIDECVGEELVEVGYVFARSAWGHGYASEATSAFVDVAQQRHDLTELGAITMDGNDASTRVLEKNGFVFERWVDHDIGPHRFLRWRAE